MGLRVAVGDRGLLEVGDRCCQKGELRGDRGEGGAIVLKM